jgi:hypothetical protein
VCVCACPLCLTQTADGDTHPQSVRNAPDGTVRHTKGCNCKKSSCLKKYCECFQGSIFCTEICKCVDCKNYDVSSFGASWCLPCFLGAPGCIGSFSDRLLYTRGGSNYVLSSLTALSSSLATRHSLARRMVVAGVQIVLLHCTCIAVPAPCRDPKLERRCCLWQIHTVIRRFIK